MNTTPDGSICTRRKREPSHADLERLAYEFWQERGCPDGSPEFDWWKAQETFQARAAAGEDTLAASSQLEQSQN
jgi:hypothetical protein